MVVLLTLSATGPFNIFLLAAAAGLGSAAGELVGYGLGYLGRKIVSNRYKRRLNAILGFFGRFGAAAVFIFAMTPLPDDLLFIPLGLLRYSLWKVFLPAVAGKFLMCLIIAYVGAATGQLWVESPIFAVVTIILLAIVIIAMFRIDWEKKLGNFTKRKPKGRLIETKKKRTISGLGHRSMHIRDHHFFGVQNRHES